MADDLWSELERAIAAARAADPKLARFGAARHRYALAPPIADPAILARLPDDARAYAARFGGGAGPYYGVLPLDRVAPLAGPDGHDWLPIAHLGCGYAAMLVLAGPARGQVWIDAHAIGVVAPIRASFTAYVVDWIDRLAHARWPDAFVPPGRCALASALTGYLGYHEQQLGLEPGALAGDALAEVLARLGPGAVEVVGGEPLFGDGEPVDPCASCLRLVENLGLSPTIVKPGRVPIVDRLHPD